MAPLLEQAHVWVFSAIGWVKRLLAVVESVGEDLRQGTGFSTSSNVLAVVSSTR